MRLPRPCIVAGCPALTSRLRCEQHEREHNRKRNADPKRAAYSDPSYRAIPVGGVCWICGEDGADTRDHIVPLALGGTNDPSNVRPAHRRCNSARGARVGVIA